MYIPSNTTFKDYIDYYCSNEVKIQLEKYYTEYVEIQNELKDINTNDDMFSDIESELEDKIDYLQEKLYDIESEVVNIKDNIQDITINDIIVKLNHIIDIAQEV